MQSQFSQANAQSSNPLHISRLNPRASVFSSGTGGPPHPNAGKMNNQPPSMSQGFGGAGGASGLFPPNANQSSNPYQKVPYSNQNPVGNQMPTSNYNPAPGRPQSQPQASSNGRWFTDFSHLNHTSPNEIMNMENGALLMAMNSPAMSPNNGNQQAPGAGSSVTAGANKNVLHNLQQDDSRKIPRPIGTERASWKYGSGSGTNLDTADGQQQLPPWLMDKSPMPSQQMSQQQQQQQPPWMQQYPMARNHFVDELHLQDPYQVCAKCKCSCETTSNNGISFSITDSNGLLQFDAAAEPTTTAAANDAINALFANDATRDRPAIRSVGP